MTSTSTTPRFSILIINPNTSRHMTDALKPIVNNLNYSGVHFDYFTAPALTSVTIEETGRIVPGVPSINSGEDSANSALHCRPFLEPLIPKHDAFLVACYSAHPLVAMLKEDIKKLEEREGSTSNSSSRRRKYVTGIFEASVSVSLSLISSFQLLGTDDLRKVQADETFGIVSTGSIWKAELSKAVAEMLAGPGGGISGTIARFAGAETTGLTAVQLHDTPPDEVRKRISDATERLIKNTSSPVTVICLGCAGMAGMEEAVRAGCIRAYGREAGERVRIVDGVVAGVGLLVNACKARF
ncbi:hypothetical protein DTO271D3_6616 [Paecilomyces variotii]|nr:hypothetical protein DTO271D3_6616 [Paecilomyces variotii]